MRAWFENLNPRERLIVSVGGTLAAMLVAWAYLWNPLVTGSSELAGAVADKQLLLIDLQRAAAFSESASVTTPARESAESLVVLVANTADSVDLSDSFSQTRPDGANSINVSFRDAPFDILVAWLVLLDSTYGVAVESATFNGTNESGIVSGQLFLTRI